MKQLSATDSARKFSDVLDSVESERVSFVVVRHGRPVATIGSAYAGTGRAVKEALRTHRPDDEWAAELREWVGPADTDPWHG